jgi:hypothetical protein
MAFKIAWGRFEDVHRRSATGAESPAQRRRPEFVTGPEHLNFSSVP